MHYSNLFTLLLIGLSFSVFGQTVSSLTFSSERGFYETPFLLTLTADEPTAVIRYTRDNTKPSITNGSIYNGPISISGTDNIRAMAYTPVSETDVETHTYIFLNDIMNSGYMNHPIQSNPIYNQLVKNALLEIPTVSITSSDVVSNNHVDDEVETSVELFFPDGTSAFNIHCGIQTWGGSPDNPKKNYRLEFKSQYGAKELEYPIFDDGFEYGIRPTSTFDELLLRAGSQDGLNAEYGNLRDPQFLRNRFLFDRELELGYPAPHGRYVHTYVNGEYMGQYHLMERTTAGFLREYYGGKKSHYETRKNGNYLDQPISPPFYDQFESYVENFNLNLEFYYTGLSNYVNLQRAADYLVLNHWIANFDWSQNHNSLGATNINAGKQAYQFMIWDVDLTLGNVGTFEDYYGALVNYDGTHKTGPIPSELLDAEEFRVLLGDRVQCHCFNEGLLTRTHLEPLYRERSNSIELPLLAETVRWAPDSWSMDDEWRVEVEDVINVFFQNRSTNLVNFYKNKGYYPSSLQAVQLSQYGGNLPNGSLTVTNPNGYGTVYYTTDGSDPRSFGGGISPTAQIYSSPIALQGVTTLKARVKSGDNWSAMCPRTFYSPQDYSNIVINELQYGPSDPCNNAEFIEFKNKGNTPINLKHSYFEEGLRFRFEEDAIIPPNGFLVLTNDSDAFLAIFGFPAYGEYIGKLSGNGELVALVDPNGNLIDEVSYDDDAPWPTSPDEEGPSLELTNSDLDNDLFGNWHPSVPDCGTPNAENSNPCYANPAGLVINEVTSYPLATYDSGDWVELHNPTANAVDISNWQLQDSKFNFFVPVGTTIPAGGYLALVENDTFFTAVYPEVSNYVGNLVFGFSAGGEKIQLLSEESCVVDAIDYDNVAPWPEGLTGEGPSLSLIDPALDNTLGENWAPSTNASGTPGAANTNFCDGVDHGIVINEINYKSSATFIPGDWLELHNTSSVAVDLTGWELHDVAKAYEFPANTIIPPNGFLVLVSDVSFFAAAYPTVQNFLGPLGFTLSSGGEKIRLFDTNRCFADVVHYDDAAPWPTEPDGFGPSLSLIDPLSDNALAQNWEASSANGTPGRENVPCPTANFTIPTEDVCTNTPTIFLANENRPGMNYTWLFENGDPGFSNALAATSSWDAIGNYKVALAIQYFECADATEQIITTQSCNNTPTPQDDYLVTNEDEFVGANVLSNDLDPNGNFVSIDGSPVVFPTNGTLGLQTSGDIYYTPNPNFSGQDSFVYRACDGSTPSFCANATVYITVLPQNDAPNLAPDNVTTNEGTPVFFNVLDNDNDIDGQLDISTLQFYPLPTASQGFFSVDNQGQATFVPAANFAGTLSMTYEVCDTGTPLPVSCATAALSITVTSENDAPVAQNDVLIANEEEPALGNVLLNDSDADGNTLSVNNTLIVEPTYGQVSMAANGVFVYLSDVDYNGTDNFTYLVCDDGVPSLCDQATVSIQVNPVNDRPIANTDNVQAAEEVPINILVLENDIDIDGDLNPTSLALTSSPPASEGLVLLNTGGTLTFIPANDFYGNVTPFTYQICDSGSIPPVQCTQGVVNIYVNNVNDAPLAQPDYLEAIEGETLTGNLLSNDSDIENNALLANPALVVPPAKGSLTLSPSGFFEYTPTIGSMGQDSFVYEVCDNGQPSACSQANVFISITPCPIATMILPTQICATSYASFEAEDQGADATYTWFFGSGAVPSFSTNRTENVLYTTGGIKTISLTVTNDICSVTQTESITVGQAAYADAGQNSILCPGESVQLGGSSTGPFGAVFQWSPSYNINNTSVAKPVVYPDTTTTYQVIVSYGNCVLTDEVTIYVENGELFADAGSDKSDCGEGVRIGGEPTGPLAGVTYSWSPTIGLDDPTSPNPLVNTPISKTYTVTVNRNGCIATDEVVVERKYPPALDAGVDRSMCFNPDVQGVLLGGDSNFPTSQYEWTPNIGLSHPFEGNTFANPPVTTVYTLTATKNGCSATDEVTVQVDICNATPFAVFDRDTLSMNTLYAGFVLANDSDPDGNRDDLEVTVVGSPLHGVVIMQPDGNYTYMPDAGYVGADEFVYQICDNGIPQRCERAKVFLTILGPSCVDLQLWALLEGAYDPSSEKMTTMLNTVHRILPGQSPLLPNVGHPYSGPPWNYLGEEGIEFDSTSYNNEVVDWVLVSVRTGVERSTEIYKTAALLERDGRIVFVADCMPFDPEETSYYVLIEHRNHIGVLTPQAIELNNNTLTYDFRSQDSYAVGASQGQATVAPNRWAMFAGDAEQQYDVSGYDISGDDKVRFSTENGSFNAYLLGDLNLDGDVNAVDKIIWTKNNGIYSIIPR